VHRSEPPVSPQPETGTLACEGSTELRIWLEVGKPDATEGVDTEAPRLESAGDPERQSLDSIEPCVPEQCPKISGHRHLGSPWSAGKPANRVGECTEFGLGDQVAHLQDGLAKGRAGQQRKGIERDDHLERRIPPPAELHTVLDLAPLGDGITAGPPDGPETVANGAPCLGVGLFLIFPATNRSRRPECASLRRRSAALDLIVGVNPLEFD